MDPTILQRAGEVWSLVRRQHGVVSRAQLLELCFGVEAIRHRIRVGRLHPVHRGVYAVGRPGLTLEGRFMAAVLACGSGAALSHASAAALWGIQPPRPGALHVSVPARRAAERPGVTVRREEHLDATVHRGIPVTTPLATLVALATTESEHRLEAAVNEADKLDLVDPETLRAGLDRAPPRPGTGRLREILDRRTFTLTDSELERRFLPIARRAGLPPPETRRRVSGFKVDFFWPTLGLVVETDGLRYHRTPAQQAVDRLRDQAHSAAGLTPLRFTRAQVRFEPGHVEEVLRAVASRLR